MGSFPQNCFTESKDLRTKLRVAQTVMDRDRQFFHSIVKFQSGKGRQRVQAEPGPSSRHDRDHRHHGHPKQEQRRAHQNAPERNDVRAVGKFLPGPPGAKQRRQIKQCPEADQRPGRTQRQQATPGRAQREKRHTLVMPQFSFLDFGPERSPIQKDLFRNGPLERFQRFEIGTLCAKRGHASQ